MPGGLHPPLSVMESWPAPNLVDPESHGPTATIVCAVFGSIALITVGVRLWARCGIQHHGGWDDILVAIALVRLSIHSPQPSLTALQLPTIGLNIAVPIG
ncbi:hypothetical protein BO71DRAFT_306856, partial [Aspergillus ellipticus CBS 707.79]